MVANELRVKARQNSRTIADIIKQMWIYEELGDIAYANSLENQVLELQKENKEIEKKLWDLKNRG